MFKKKESNEYKMKEIYNTNDLVVANLEYVSSVGTEAYSPIVKQTEQKYIFEVISQKGKTRYRELFTGFITDSESSSYFDVPYLINVSRLKDEIPTIHETISKYALLIVLNEVNAEKKRLKK